MTRHTPFFFHLLHLSPLPSLSLSLLPCLPISLPPPFSLSLPSLLTSVSPSLPPPFPSSLPVLCSHLWIHLRKVTLPNTIHLLVSTKLVGYLTLPITSQVFNLIRFLIMCEIDILLPKKFDTVCFSSIGIGTLCCIYL